MFSPVERAEKICRTIGIDISPADLVDIGINFYESVIKSLTGIDAPVELSIRDRYEKVLEVVESLVGVPLTHLSVISLQNNDATTTNNLLEILEFLIDAYMCKYNDVNSDASSCNSDEGLCSGEFSLQSLIRSVEGSSELLDSSNFPNRRTNYHSEISSPTDTLETVSDINRVHQNLDPKKCSSEPTNCRMCFLHTKLKQYLGASNYIKDKEPHSPSPRAMSCCSGSDKFVPFESKSPRIPTRGGALIKEHVKTLIPKYPSKYPSIRSSDSSPRNLDVIENINEHQSLLDRMLAEFPQLDLNEHDRKILQQKTSQAMKIYSNQSSSENLPNNLQLKHKQSDWIEERQKRRLAQLMKHDRQIDRLREQRATEAVNRRVREEARERRHQLVRARKYYQEFVKEFRSRKLAKIANEEQVFRCFFEELLRRERDHLNELRKLEHEDRIKKEAERENELLTLEHAHRTRLDLLNESLRKQCEERNIRMKEDRLEFQRRRRDLRRFLEFNIREIQEAIVTCQDSAQFRKRDAQRLLGSKQTYVT